MCWEHSVISVISLPGMCNLYLVLGRTSVRHTPRVIWPWVKPVLFKTVENVKDRNYKELYLEEMSRDDNEIQYMSLDVLDQKRKRHSWDSWQNLNAILGLDGTVVKMLTFWSGSLYGGFVLHPRVFTKEGMSCLQLALKWWRKRRVCLYVCVIERERNVSNAMKC